MSALSMLGLAAGLYSLELEVVTATQVPFFGRAEITTTSYVDLELVQTEDGLEARQVVCDVRVDSTAKAARTLIPPAFVRALPEQRYPVRVGADGSLILDPGPMSFGLAGEEVIDVDRDGHPGATVELEVPVFGEVQVYVVQRAHTVLVGGPEDGGWGGRVEVRRMDQRTIGASNVLFRSNPRVEVVPGASRFRIRPRAPGSSCASG